MCVLVAVGMGSEAHARSSRPSVHKIESGQTFGGIAERYGCTVEALLKANPSVSDPNRIVVGRSLKIPRKCAPAKAPAPVDPNSVVVEENDTLWGIAHAHGCGVDELIRANPKLKTKGDRVIIHPGNRLKIPSCQGPAVLSGGGKRTQCRWAARDIARNAGKLKAQMDARGFRPPSKFRALVVKVGLDRSEDRIVKTELFDYKGLGWSHKGWNPASTVKIYSGVSAMEALKRWGFAPDKTTATFHYGNGSKSFKIYGKDGLYEKAVHISKNLPHNRLVQLAGFDAMNGPRGTLKRAGLDFSYVTRAYAQGKWKAQGRSPSLKSSPAITLSQPGKKDLKIPARKGGESWDCPCRSSACTSLSDLAKMMCVLMLHEQLPKNRRLGFGKGQDRHLKFIRNKLNRKRAHRKDPVWDVLEEAFIPRGQRAHAKRGGYQIFRKSGFARDWASDILYIYQPGTRTRWIIAMAGYPGRYCLKKAAKVLADIIRGGDL